MSILKNWKHRTINKQENKNKQGIKNMSESSSKEDLKKYHFEIVQCLYYKLGFLQKDYKRLDNSLLLIYYQSFSYI